jgi:hypothetical protein
MEGDGAVSDTVTAESDQRLPCAICLVRGIQGSIGSCGPFNNLCVACWRQAGGDVRFTAEFFDDVRPVGGMIH